MFSKKLGFISSRSTVLQLINVTDKWTEALDQGSDIDEIYTNKAYVRVSHRRSIEKIISYCLDERYLGWIK